MLYFLEFPLSALVLHCNLCLLPCLTYIHLLLLNEFKYMLTIATAAIYKLSLLYWHSNNMNLKSLFLKRKNTD